MAEKLRSVRLNQRHRSHMKSKAREEIQKANPKVSFDSNETINRLVAQLFRDDDTEREIAHLHGRIKALHADLTKREVITETADDGTETTASVYVQEMEDRSRSTLKTKLERIQSNYFERSSTKWVRIQRPEELRIPDKKWEPVTRYKEDGTIDTYRSTTEENRPKITIWSQQSVYIPPIQMYESDGSINAQKYGEHSAFKELIAYLDRAMLQNYKSEQRTHEAIRAMNTVFDSCASTKQLLELLPSAERYMPDSLREQMRATVVKQTVDGPSPGADAAKILQQNAARARLLAAQGQEQISKDSGNDSESSGGSW